MRVVALVLAATAATGLWGCKKEAASTPSRPLPEVMVIAVSPQTVPDEPEFIGQAEASRPVEIRSQVTGTIKEVFVPEGRDVKEGDRLYQIDPVPFRAALFSAKAKVDQAIARVVQARQNLERVKPLLLEQAVSQKDVDDAIAEDLASKANLEAARGDLVKARFDFNNTSITAPIAGRVERSRFYEGRLVSAQTDLLTIIHRLDPMYVMVSAPESFLLKRRHERASKRVQGAGVYELRGIITFTDGSTYQHEGVLDLLEVGLRTTTGTLDVRVVFPNPEKDLLPGQFVKVKFLGAVRTAVILVPQRAVLHGAHGPIVYVVGNDNKIEARDVQATAWSGNEWVIEEGLKTGERVVVEGLQRAMPGATVKPIPFKEAAAEPKGETPGSKPDAKTKEETPGAKPEHQS